MVAITKFSRVMADKKTKQADRFWCKRCLRPFTKEEYLVDHLKVCKHTDMGDTITKMAAHKINLTNKVLEPAKALIGFVSIDSGSLALEDDSLSYDAIKEKPLIIGAEVKDVENIKAGSEKNDGIHKHPKKARAMYEILTLFI